MNVFQLLQTSVDAATLRQKVYANNIANANTPNYKRQDVAFETYFQQALQTPEAQVGEYHIPLSTGGANLSIPNVSPQVVTDSSTSIDNNGNNADVTSEMTALAQNEVRYDTLVQDISTRLGRLRTAIQGG